MSSSTSTSSSSPKTIDIIHINRISNTQTFQTARAFRKTYRPTYHAQKRARKLNLCVSIEAALKLDPKQISTIPLPVLETPPLSPEQQAPALLEPAAQISRSVVGREREMKRLARPVLRCNIPRDIKPEVLVSSAESAYSNENSESASSAQAPLVLRGQNVPWRLVTSCWSASTVDDSADEEETGLENTTVYSFDSEDDLGLPSSYEADGVSPREAVSFTHEIKFTEWPLAQTLTPLQLDLNRYSWGSDATNGDSPLSFSSNGPVTPEETTQPKLVIRVKRSIPCDDELEDSEALEKRPKYERKSWVSRTRRTVKLSIRNTKA